MSAPDLILQRGLFTTLDRGNPTASAVAIKDGVFTAVGQRQRRDEAGWTIDQGHRPEGRRVLPGLIDNHLHIIRGGLNFNMELRWDGVRSLADAMAMLKTQVAITPPPQWVRVVGGFTEHQFAEKRLPTLDELNAAAPDTPVFILHLYDRALLNARGAARRRLHEGHARSRRAARSCATPTGDPTGLLLAKPNADDPLRDARQGPEAAVRLSDQLDAALHARAEPARRHRRDRRRRRLPELSGRLCRHREAAPTKAQLTVRIAYNLFTQKPKGEKDGLPGWTKQVEVRAGRRLLPPQRRRRDAGVLRRRLRGFPRRRVRTCRRRWKASSRRSCACSPQNRWPWRLHATYDETISRALDVFEKVNRDMPLDGLHWFFDHAETISRPVDRPHRRARRRHRRAAPHGLSGRVFRRALRRGAAEATPPVQEDARQGRPGRRRHRRDARRLLQSLGVAVLAGHRPDRRRACASTRSATASIARRRCGCGPRTSPGSPTRKARRAASRSGSSPT